MQTTTQVIVPTKTYSFFGGRVQGMACGKHVGDFGSHDVNLLNMIGGYAARLGVRRVFMPNCARFNALTCSEQHFVEKPIMTDSCVEFRSGVFLDGFFIDNPRDACAFKTADCPTLVAYFPDKRVFVAHAGLGSIVNLERIKEKECRDHESVIDEVFRSWCGDVSQVRAEVVCGIQAQSFVHRFDDTKYGKFNQKLVAHVVHTYGSECISKNGPGDENAGKIDLFKIIRAQLKTWGVLPSHVQSDNVNTADGACTWWSHRRWYDKGQRGPDGRNLVMFWRSV